MRPPPPNALRAFEAAARHGGFIAAAEELHVTRGAVSRHVKLLETHLGVALFHRRAQGVRLTLAGQRLSAVLTEAFGTIQREVERIAADATVLRVICPPATSIRWLIPRLDDFRRRHPEIRVRMTTDFHADGGFDPSENDIGFSVADWPNRARNIKSVTLFPVLLTPACAPRLLETGPPLDHPAALAHYPLLHETPDHIDWTDWLAAFDVDGVDPESGDDFPNLDMATKAAVMGAGVVMADLALCREELASGALVAPFPHMVCPSPLGGICLLASREKWEEPKVRAFRTWAAEVAGREAAELVTADPPGGGVPSA